MSALAREPDLSPSHFSLAYEELADRRAGGEPPWLARLRSEAMARFRELGLPTTRQEDWKYTNLAPLGRTAFRLAGEAPSVSASDLARYEFPAAARLVFVDGRLDPKLSSLSRLPEGVRVAGLARTLAESPESVEPHLGRIAPGLDNGNAMTALNTALLDDGAFVHLAPGAAVEGPIHLLFYSARAGPTLSAVRNLVVAEAGSQASIVETYAGAEGSVSFTSAVTEISVSEGSSIETVRFQRESESAFHVGSVDAALSRDAVFRSLLVSLGAALARNEVNVLFSEPGGECELNGLFAGRGDQRVDNRTVIDHAAPHCTSRELYKGVMAGRSRGTFNGRIVVRPGAQKTDAVQTNKNLLLSREALVNSTPALEILADDVKCKHGSTIGRLDETALFYLRSRGIGEKQARGLLTWAFAADIVGRVKIEPVRAELEAFLRARLGEGEEP